jgi:hypothetical protein
LIEFSKRRRPQIADDIVKAIAAAGHDVREGNPFSDTPSELAEDLWHLLP